MTFRQLYDSVSSTFTYLLADPRTGKAVLIDPVFEKHERDAALLRELDLELVYTLDTHCHADHVTGAWLMQAALGSRIATAAAVGADPVDVPLRPGDVVEIGDTALEVRATPGHTDGCLSFVTPQRDRVFTGDALLIRGCGRTDFQQGSAETLYRSITEQLFSLPDECLVYPGHDYAGRTASTIGEEKAHNPRIGGGARVEDFVGTMANLGLPHPKQLAVAVPANLRSGKPESGQLPEGASWGPVVTTYAGLQEVHPDWVATHGAELQVVDVREPVELDGELGRIDHARNVPLGQLRERLGELSRQTPVVLVCQTGKRSAQATKILRDAGFEKVANVAGGMVRWRQLGL